MIKYIYKIWERELEDRASNDKQIQNWVLNFVKFAEGLIGIDKVKKGGHTKVHLGRRRFYIKRDL